MVIGPHYRVRVALGDRSAGEQEQPEQSADSHKLWHQNCAFKPNWMLRAGPDAEIDPKSRELRIRIHAAKIRVVQEIEHVRLETNLETFGDGEFLSQGEVQRNIDGDATMPTPLLPRRVSGAAANAAVLKYARPSVRPSPALRNLPCSPPAGTRSKWFRSQWNRRFETG